MEKKHIGILAVILLFDQLTKFAVDACMELHQRIPVIRGLFFITYTRHTGAAWSILEGRMIFFYLITIAAVVGLWFFYKNTQMEERWTRLAIIFMMGGALGNFIDRLLFQYVRDFLDVIIFGYDFPIFNVADCFLCIGVGLLLLDILLEHMGVIRT